MKLTFIFNSKVFKISSICKHFPSMLNLVNFQFAFQFSHRTISLLVSTSVWKRNSLRSRRSSLFIKSCQTLVVWYIFHLVHAHVKLLWGWSIHFSSRVLWFKISWCISPNLFGVLQAIVRCNILFGRCWVLTSIFHSLNSLCRKL